jgi:hypothetical protein
MAKAEKGEEAVDRMNETLMELFQSYSMHLLSFYKAIMG